MRVQLSCGKRTRDLSLVRAAVLSGFLLGAAHHALAQESLPDEDAPRAAGYLLHYFADSDDIHVLSQYGTYDWALKGSADVSVQWNHEVVRVPGVAAPAGSAEAVDAITTASRPIATEKDAYSDYAKVRNELTAGLNGRHYRVGYYVSSERDYFAQQVRAQIDREFFDRTLDLSIGSSYGWDDIQPLRDADTPGANGTRSTWHWSAVVTRVMAPTSVLRAGAEINRVDGLQHSPYRNVYAGGGRVPERHPRERQRRDLFVRFNQYFHNRSSVKLLYRWYGDDWGVRSHTAGLRLAQYVSSRAVVEYRYRYYTQGKADFYLDEYPDPDGIGGYRTGDYRLGAFDAHLFGGRIDLGLGGVISGPRFLEPLAMNLGYERYFNSNNFSANVFETGLSLPF